MHTCPYCRKGVPNLANHYGGFQCDPCPDVLRAFGPDEPLMYVARAKLTPDSWSHNMNARRRCLDGCDEPVYRRGRCLEHFRANIRRTKERERAKASAATLSQATP